MMLRDFSKGMIIGIVELLAVNFDSRLISETRDVSIDLIACIAISE